MKQLAAFLFLLLLPGMLRAQPETTTNAPLTWLGLDFTQLRFIGTASQYMDAGPITDESLRDKYFTGWNRLFVSEPKKYDISRYTGRPEIQYALEVTETANNKARGSFFSDDPAQYQQLNAVKVGDLVRKYDFMGKTGTGLVFFVEGISKGREEVSAWVTYVDMSTRKVLQTRRMTGAAGGVGFRNYWAKGYRQILKNIPTMMR